MNEIIWGPPPPKLSWVEELIKKPGEWGHIDRLFDISNCSKLRRDYPNIEWEFHPSAGNNRKGHIYGRTISDPIQ